MGAESLIEGWLRPLRKNSKAGGALHYSHPCSFQYVDDLGYQLTIPSVLESLGT